MSISRGNTAAHAVLSECLYVIGGRDEQGRSLKSVEYYDPSTDDWETVAPMLHERQNTAACTSNGLIYVFGGQNDGDGGVLQSIEKYDPDEDSWAEVISIFNLNRILLNCDYFFFRIFS